MYRCTPYGRRPGIVMIPYYGLKMAHNRSCTDTIHLPSSEGFYCDKHEIAGRSIYKVLRATAIDASLVLQ